MEEKLQVAVNDWVKRICRATREDRWKMEEWKEEIGNKKPT